MGSQFCPRPRNLRFVHGEPRVRPPSHTASLPPLRVQRNTREQVVNTGLFTNCSRPLSCFYYARCLIPLHYSWHYSRADLNGSGFWLVRGGESAVSLRGPGKDSAPPLDHYTNNAAMPAIVL